MEQQKCAQNDHRMLQVDEQAAQAIQTMLDHQMSLLVNICEKKHINGLYLAATQDNETCPEVKVKWVLEMISCMSNELEELRDALPWKHWKTYSEDHFMKQLPEIKYEVIDLLHFLLEMMLILRIDGKEMMQLYTSKNQQNKDRQANGY
jgi:hypothetical protein